LWAVLASTALTVVVVFGSGLRAWFVSDAWIFLRRSQLPAGTLLQHLMPSNEGFYRPIVEVAFWVEQRLFGFHVLPYHLAALTAHAVSSVLLGWIVWESTRSKIAAAVAGLIFVFSIHAHEVVFDVADLHNAIGGVFLMAAVLAFVRGHRYLPAVFTLLLFLVDESGLLVFPISVLATLVFRDRRARANVRGLLALGGVAVGYVAWRYTGGGFGNEVTDQCSTTECLVAGAGQYFNRLFLRPDALIVKEAPTLAIALTIVGLILLLQPWRWNHVRTALFGAGWTVGTSAFFILALWPYIADRFLYIPSAGVAIVGGSLAAEAVRRSSESMGSAIAAGLVVGTLAAWIAVGAFTLNARGALWTGAGVRAAHIVQQVMALYPHPRPEATFSFRGVPHSFAPVIPPGNTGPYVFHNGLPEALAVAYVRDDLDIVENLPLQGQGNERRVIRLAIYTSGLVVVDPEY
jgi:hypothetical protein